ncbi:MAG: XdhC family protein [Cyanobacteria bacterium P01_D01_bin.6]
MTIALYQKLAEKLRSQPVVIATVIETKGSVPREVGAKMLIGADWIFDTIGGGAGEAKMIAQGRSLLETGQKQRAHIDLTGEVNALKEGICGGQMSLWLERWSGPEALNLAESIVLALQKGQSLQLITPFSTEETPIMGPAVRVAVNRQLTPTALIECLTPPPLLLIVGAGHVGEALAKVAHLAGFQIAIQDERSQFANPDLYPQASFIFTAAIDQILQQVNQYPALYVALVTRGYPFDLAALASILEQNIACRYIGMIGSQKRVQIVLRSLREQGISDAQLDSLHAPIGLQIGALTPGEIAVSICAELIQVRREAEGDGE